jgi:DNA repair photolyase
MAKLAANKTELNPTLFPILQPARASGGLARLAAQAEAVDEGHDVEFRALPVRSVLNRSVSKRMKWMAWSINPYRGCEFGCRYCYARYTHEFMATPDPGQQPSNAAPDFRDPELFERLIFLKENAAWLLEQELRTLSLAGRTGQEIALGTATDPYQPIERTARITRSLLEVFARRSGHRLGIVTKSRLITRDIDLLQQIAQHNTLVIHITITTPDPALARLLEPRAPRPDLRFEAVRTLRQAGLKTGILCSPLLPGITDTQSALNGMARRAAAANASFFAAQPLFLKSCSRPTYLKFVEAHFPHLAADYARRFATRDFADAAYRSQLKAMVQSACKRHGLSERSTDALLTRDVGTVRKPPVSVGHAIQGHLFG